MMLKIGNSRRCSHRVLLNVMAGLVVVFVVGFFLTPSTQNSIERANDGGASALDTQTMGEDDSALEAPGSAKTHEAFVASTSSETEGNTAFRLTPDMARLLASHERDERAWEKMARDYLSGDAPLLDATPRQIGRFFGPYTGVMSEELLERLIERGIPFPDGSITRAMQPLYELLEYGPSREVQEKVLRKVDLLRSQGTQFQPGGDTSPMQAAVRANMPLVVQGLLQRGYPVAADSDLFVTLVEARDGDTALADALIAAGVHPGPAAMEAARQSNLRDRNPALYRWLESYR